MWRATTYNTSKVTLELREIVADGVDIWDFDYDGFYTNEMKKAFELKVINHYYFRQIGFETVGRFLHAFRTKIREIMPYYKQLYESELLMKKQSDPFESYWLEETFTTEKTGTGTASTTGSGSGSSSASSNSMDTNNTTVNNTSEGKIDEDKTHRFSNTPQGSIEHLENYITEGARDDNTTATRDTLTGSTESETSSNMTSTSSNESTSTQSAESSTTESESHTLLRRGNIGVQSLGDEVNKLRKSFINIDMMIINELQELFLQVY